jgi:hypothetical protein
MNKKFSNSVYKSLLENTALSLRLLLEEEDKKEDEDPFSMPEDNEDEESAGEQEGGVEADVGDLDVVKDDSSEDEDESVTKEQFNQLLDDLSMIKRIILGTQDPDSDGTEEGTGSIESHISYGISGLSESDVSRKNKNLVRESYMNIFKSFLLEEDDKDAVDAVEAEIDDLDRVLTKGTELVDKFKKGNEVDIEKYVNVSLNAFKNFDNLFSKESIVKQATINVLVLNSGAKAEENISKFKERFHEELSKQFGINYEDQVLVSDKTSTASGAKSQG